MDSKPITIQQIILERWIFQRGYCGQCEFSSMIAFLLVHVYSNPTIPKEVDIVEHGETETMWTKCIRWILAHNWLWEIRSKGISLQMFQISKVRLKRSEQYSWRGAMLALCSRLILWVETQTNIAMYQRFASSSRTTKSLIHRSDRSSINLGPLNGKNRMYQRQNQQTNKTQAWWHDIIQAWLQGWAIRCSGRAMSALCMTSVHVKRP